MAAISKTFARLGARRSEQTPQALARLAVVGLFIALWFALWTAQIPMPVPFLLVLIVEMAFFILYWRLVFILPNEKAIEVAYYGMLAAEIVFHTTMVYFLGSVSWLGTFAYVFGLIFTNTFLDMRKAFVYTAGATLAFSSLILLEATGTIPHYVYLEQGSLRYTDARFVATTLIGAGGVFFSIYVWVNWVGRQLRQERDAAVNMQDDLLQARAELQQANEELEERVKERTGLLELANAALHDSEQRLRTVIGNAPVALFALDRDGIFTLAEGKALDDLGIQPGALVGRSSFDMFEGQNDAHEVIRAALAGKAGTTIVGSGVQLEAQLTPLRDDSGDVAGVIGVAFDITERTLAEALLSGQRRVLEMIAVSAPLKQVLESLVTVLEEQSEDMICGICLVDAQGTSLQPIAGPSLPAEFREGLAAGVPIAPNAGSCGTAAFRKQPVIVSDIASDPLWEDFRELALANDLRACWSTPIFSRSGDVLGTFAIYYSEPRNPDARTSGLVEIATRLAGIAIERKRAEEQIGVLARFPEENPSPVLRIGQNGIIIYANGPSLPLLEAWGCEVGQPLREDWHPLIRQALASGSTEEVETESGQRRFSMMFAPIVDAGYVNLYGRDITERSQAEAAVRESESNFRAMAETVSAATFIFQGAKMRYVNSAAEQLTGYNRAELLEMNFWDMIHPDFQPMVKERGLARQDGEQPPSAYEVKILTRDGRTRWVDFTAGKVDFEGATAILGTAFDITERKQAEEALREAANHDPLTGLLNRRAGLAAIEERLELAKNATGRFAVLVLDLDKFKAINDSFSHETGDAALVQFSKVMVDLVGDRGVTCRMGGDEFQIGMDDTGPEEAFGFARKLQDALRRSLDQSDAELRPQFTVSIGIACYPQEGTTPLVLGRRADRAMYAAKVAGANTYRAWHQLQSQAA